MFGWKFGVPSVSNIVKKNTLTDFNGNFGLGQKWYKNNWLHLWPDRISIWTQEVFHIFVRPWLHLLTSFSLGCLTILRVGINEGLRFLNVSCCCSFCKEVSIIHPNYFTYQDFTWLFHIILFEFCLKTEMSNRILQWFLYCYRSLDRCINDSFPFSIPPVSLLPRYQGSWGQHGAHLGPTGPRWAPCWPHEPCYLGLFLEIFLEIHFRECCIKNIRFGSHIP